MDVIGLLELLPLIISEDHDLLAARQSTAWEDFWTQDTDFPPCCRRVLWGY